MPFRNPCSIYLPVRRRMQRLLFLFYWTENPKGARFFPCFVYISQVRPKTRGNSHRFPLRLPKIHPYRYVPSSPGRIPDPSHPDNLPRFLWQEQRRLVLRYPVHRSNTGIFRIPPVSHYILPTYTPETLW